MVRPFLVEVEFDDLTSSIMLVHFDTKSDRRDCW